MRLCALLVVFCCSSLSPRSAWSWDDTLVRIGVDNTLQVRHKGRTETISLYGLSPISRQPAARERVRRFLLLRAAGQRVKVHPVGSNDQGDTQALVYSNGHNLNEALIRAGLMRVDREGCRYYYCNQWIRYQQFAQQRSQGNWQ
ncbi:thermonuclease family protein [Desulfogranum mediterraneum]|uniref:thermonuclease family protein n=1 Tax=Desulfogranum mediterraneum TaxID=160661 RepID=UPI001377CB2B|nr:thermonuclease family protein [Desulfogranum mediterraneum]